MVRFLRDPPRDVRKNAIAPPKNYFSRRVQYQLLALVFTLMLVLVLMQEAAKPQNWTWLWRGQPTEDSPVSEVDSWADGERLGTAQVDKPDESIDTRLAPADPRAVVRSPGTIHAPAPLPVAEPRLAPVPGYLPGVDPARLADIEDDTMFQSNETAVWYELLGVLATVDDETWRAQQPIQVGFVQLYRQPDVYRGKLISVRGTVYRVSYVKSAESRSEVDGYWQLWLRPEGTNQVMVVYSLSVPAGFPPGPSMKEDVEVAGLFFKRWAYLAKDGPRSAPLVLAREPIWKPAPQAEQIALPSLGNAIAAVIGVGLLAMGIAWWAMRPQRGPSQAATAIRKQGLNIQAVSTADTGPRPIGPSSLARGNEEDESKEGLS
jgi:hypothetical protein